MDLSTIINDLLTGEAKLISEAFTFTAAAGGAISETFFRCPPNTLRLIIAGFCNLAKTTATAFTIFLTAANGQGVTYLINRTLGTEAISLITDDGSTKDAAETPASSAILLQFGDFLEITHALTAGETIADIIYITWVEWQTGKRPELREREKIVFVAPPIM